MQSNDIQYSVQHALVKNDQDQILTVQQNGLVHKNITEREPVCKNSLQHPHFILFLSDSVYFVELIKAF